MAEPFIGQVSMFAFNYAPRGWLLCNGQLLSISQNAALFSILGTTYGGNGTTTFGLPNLQGRVPLHKGTSFVEGQTGGSANVTLNSSQFGHTHAVNAVTAATTNLAAGNYPATSPNAVYGSSPGTTMNAGVVSTVGGAQPHNNMQPYLVVSFAIATVGIFPSRN